MSRLKKVLHLGDDINTDDIIPANRATTDSPEYLKHYALEHLIGEGKLVGYDMIEAGENFGCGSSREIAPIALKAAGIRKVRAHSFGEIFYRNSINIGLTVEIISQELDNPIIKAITGAGGLIPYNHQRRSGQLSIPRNKTSPRPMTMVEKILSKASGNTYVQPGEVIFAKLDLAMSHDAVAASVAKVFYQHFGKQATVWDAKRVVLVADHFIQINDIRKDQKADELYQQMVQFAKTQQCYLFDVI
ncbi:MAG: homoaconitate hydratase family protein, partial [Okeania sp. SIO2D1]|nr:homoaconitate hydratase family protein [Okeania sp. SIO2D1]